MVEFTEGIEANDLKTVESSLEVWPFIESGRCLKTFDTVQKLGEGANGAVYKVKHKLDDRVYALKKVKLHLEFKQSLTDDPLQVADANRQTLLSHPAMKEI